MSLLLVSVIQSIIIQFPKNQTQFYDDGEYEIIVTKKKKPKKLKPVKLTIAQAIMQNIDKGEIPVNIYAEEN